MDYSLTSEPVDVMCNMIEHGDYGDSKKFGYPFVRQHKQGWLAGCPVCLTCTQVYPSKKLAVEQWSALNSKPYHLSEIIGKNDKERLSIRAK